MIFKEYFVLSEMPHMQIDYELEQFSPNLPINHNLSYEQIINLFEEYIKKLSSGQKVITRKNHNEVQIFPKDRDNFIEDISSDAFLGYFYNGVKLGYIKFPEMVTKSKIYSKLDIMDKQKIRDYILSLVRS
jgi:hypothetical protein